MTRFRWLLPGSILIASVTLAFVLRDVAYQLIVVPLAYVLWLAGVYYSAVPQLVIWGLLTLFLFLGVTWKLVPDVATSPRRQIHRPLLEGQVESLAVCLLRGRNSNYFKWQVANRLARLARRVSEGFMQPEGTEAPAESVQQYLAAGLNQSFVDFPAPRSRFRRRTSTPLDLDPNDVVDYLESRMELSRDRRR
jgi:hypothetical protein